MEKAPKPWDREKLEKLTSERLHCMGVKAYYLLKAEESDREIKLLTETIGDLIKGTVAPQELVEPRPYRDTFSPTYHPGGSFRWKRIFDRIEKMLDK